MLTDHKILHFRSVGNLLQENSPSKFIVLAVTPELEVCLRGVYRRTISLVDQRDTYVQNEKVKDTTIVLGFTQKSSQDHRNRREILRI